MDNTFSDLIMVTVKHPREGVRENGKFICDEIRKRLRKKEGLICFFHDAADMVMADADYILEFLELETALKDRICEIVFASPFLAPRIMAYTAAKYSDNRWTIYETMREAKGYLALKGIDVNLAVGPSVNVASVPRFPPVIQK
jgi:hypothetical protein